MLSPIPIVPVNHRKWIGIRLDGQAAPSSHIFPVFTAVVFSNRLIPWALVSLCEAYQKCGGSVIFTFNHDHDRGCIHAAFPGINSSPPLLSR